MTSPMPLRSYSVQQKNYQAISKFVRAAAWLSVCWERLWPLLVPLSLVVLVFFGLTWAGIWAAVPWWLHIVIFGLFVVTAGGSLMKLRHMSWPELSALTRRIEKETQLSDRPILAQVDEIALGQNDELAGVFWSEHRQRMAAKLHNLTSGSPKAKGDRFDPYGLRLFLPIIVFVTFMFSFGSAGGRLSDAFQFHSNPEKLLTRLDLWINPPDYTRKPPIYLSAEGKHQAGQILLVPQFSELAGRFAGAGDISIWYQRADDTNGDKKIEIVPETITGDNPESAVERVYSFKMEYNGSISAMSRNTQISQWSFNLIEDKKPVIRFEKEPDSSLSGSLQLSYHVEDDYGVTVATGLVEQVKSGGGDKSIVNSEKPARFVAPANARPLVEPLEIKLPLPRRRARSGASKVNRDLSKHPLAGSLVNLTLNARDDIDQIGSSETKQIILPGRVFSNPLAKALIEQRRILAMDSNQKLLVISMLDALTTAPELFFDDFSAHLAISVARRRLVAAQSENELKEVMDLFWDIALGIEFGKMSDLEKKLRDAQERLSKALEDGASDKEIDKLMKELRQAMNELMQALIEQARKNPQSQNPMMQNDTARQLRQRDLERMLDRIEDLAKSGSKDAARQLLSEMQRMMDNLRAGRHMQQRQAEGNQMNKALDKLSDLMQKQQKLMDETFRQGQQQLENQRQSNRQNQNNQQPDQRQKNNQQNPNGQNQEMTAQEYADAMKQLRQQQKALQEQLDSLNRQLQELGLQPSDEFNEAGKQMGKAGKKLGQGEAGEAVGNQGQALDALKKGAQSIMRQMAGERQQGGEQQSEGNANSNNRQGRDPLGRNQNKNGNQLGSNTKIPGEIDAQNARRVMEAIRKRLSEPGQPIIEKDYLERLLQNR
jgi:uncharacterized protein (TIGR02302 family)